MSKCLYCYRPLAEGQTDFHPACAKRFFGTSVRPELNYSLDQLDQLAAQVIKQQTTLTGVQPKLSLNLQRHEGGQRLTIVGLWGNYICKPQTAQFKMLPEIEDLTMHLAEVAKIDIVPHTLMRMGDDSICYLTRRVDRLPDGQKIAMEDMCQITERPTEYKYKGSYERIGKAILQYSSVPQLDVVNFFETVLFCWLTGNNDMHLKNFSLYEPTDGKVRLCPIYDLLNVHIVNPADQEELALTLNGRKSHIENKDFFAAAQTLGIDKRIVERLFKKYEHLYPKMHQWIKNSFLTPELQLRYDELVRERINRLSTDG